MARPAGFEPATMGFLLEAYPKTHTLSRLSYGRNTNTGNDTIVKVYREISGGPSFFLHTKEKHPQGHSESLDSFENLK